MLRSTQVEPKRETGCEPACSGFPGPSPILSATPTERSIAVKGRQKVSHLSIGNKWNKAKHDVGIAAPPQTYNLIISSPSQRAGTVK